VTGEWRNFVSLLLAIYYCNDHVREGEIGRAYSTHGTGVNIEFWYETLKERDNYEDSNEAFGSI
jgi:hypothetical protein